MIATRRHNGYSEATRADELFYLDVYPGDFDACVEYGIAARSFSRGRESRSGNPLDPSGEDAEIGLAPIVAVYHDGREVGVTTLEIALLEYAADRRITLDAARDYAETQALEVACERAAHEADGDEWDEPTREWATEARP